MLPKKYNTVVINVLLAIVISLVVNFSYLLAIRQQDFSSLDSSEELTRHEGVLSISRDGYGYLLCDHHPAATRTDSLAATERLPEAISAGSADSLAPALRCDSIYVSWWNISRLELQEGSRMEILARESRFPDGNRVLAFIERVDGAPFDYAAAYNRPGDGLLFGIQGMYYILLSFILLTIMTAGASKNTSVKFYLKRTVLCVVVAMVLYFLMPVMKFRADDIIPVFMNTLNGVMIFDHFVVLKCSFVLLFVLLYARTYQLISQKEDIILENELLKNENLKARYNTLISQINPHFLFNSLNSLSSLVREGQNDDAVTYIDRLSDTFRYTIQNEPHTTTTLQDELEFVAAYKYLLEIRYDEKLFIDIDVEKEKLDWILPTFSIQPLIENAVKHNTITRAKPLRISIRTEGVHIVVSNPLNPKIEPEKSTGIGLENLSKRWMLVTGKNIEISNDGVTFSVKLPFLNTSAQ